MRINWLKIGFWIAVVAAFLIVASSVAGVYQIGWGIPAHKVTVAELTQERDAWKSWAKKLDKYVAKLDKYVAKLETAMNFEKLFIMLQNPNAIMLVKDLQDKMDNKAKFCLEPNGGE